MIKLNTAIKIKICKYCIKIFYRDNEKKKVINLKWIYTLKYK